MTRAARTLAALLLAPAAVLSEQAEAPAPAPTPPSAAGPAASPSPPTPAAAPAAAPEGGVRGSLPPPRLVPMLEGERAIPRGAVLVEVAGSVREVDRAHQRVTIETATGPVTLSMDRNTLVYGPAGLGTVLDLTPGAAVRAGRNADMVAYWLTVRAPGPPAPGAAPVPGKAATPAPASPGGETRQPPNPSPAPASGAPGSDGASPAAPGGAGR